MANRGLLGAFSGFGKGLSDSALLEWKDQMQKERDARLSEIEMQTYRDKQSIEVDSYRQKKEIDQEYVDPKDRYVSVGSGGLFDTQTGSVVSGKGGALLGGFADAEELNTKASSLAKTMLGGDNFMADFNENRQARVGALSDRGQQLYKTGEFSTLAGAMDAAYQQMFADKNQDLSDPAAAVKAGQYDPPGLDLWGMRDSSTAEEMVLDLKTRIEGGLLPNDRKSVAKFISGTMSPEQQQNVLDSLFAPSSSQQGDVQNILAEARDAISRGANREKVIERLKSMGLPTEGL